MTGPSHTVRGSLRISVISVYHLWLCTHGREGYLNNMWVTHLIFFLYISLLKSYQLSEGKHNSRWPGISPSSVEWELPTSCHVVKADLC
jgi:hypothetical protein